MIVALTGCCLRCFGPDWAEGTPQANTPTSQRSGIAGHRLGEAQPSQKKDAIELVIGAGHSQSLTAVAASRDGRYVLSASLDGSIRLWDVIAGQEVRTFSTSSPIEVLGFNSDATRFVAAPVSGGSP